MALVPLHDVDFAYDERPVLRRISFDAARPATSSASSAPTAAASAR